MADHYEKVWAPINIDTHIPEAIHVQTYEPTEEQIYAWHNHIWQEFYLVPVGDMGNNDSCDSCKFFFVNSLTSMAGYGECTKFQGGGYYCQLQKTYWCHQYERKDAPAPEPSPTLTLENGLVRIKLPKGLLVLTYGEYRRGIKRGRACRRAASESKREPNQWPIGSNSK